MNNVVILLFITFHHVFNQPQTSLGMFGKLLFSAGSRQFKENEDIHLEENEDIHPEEKRSPLETSVTIKW